jgi:imidazolonepropionase-like amidohydrolase
VTSHCNTDEGARNAIEGGIGGIEHGGLLSDETLNLMAKKGIHYTPTLIIQDVSLSTTRSGLIRRLIAKVHREWADGSTGAKVLARKAKLIAKNSYKVVKRAHELGVNIAYGTDAPAPIMLAEFDLRAKVLPAAAILQQATCNGGELR